MKKSRFVQNCNVRPPLTLSTSYLIKCLICCDQLELSEHNSKTRHTVKNCVDVGEHFRTDIIFVLENVFNFSSAQVNRLMNSEYIYYKLCDDCRRNVEMIKHILQELQRVTKEYEEAKSNMRETLEKGSVSNDGTGSVKDCQKILQKRMKDASFQIPGQIQTSVNQDNAYDNFPSEFEMEMEEESIDVKPDISFLFNSQPSHLETDDPLEDKTRTSTSANSDLNNDFKLEVETEAHEESDREETLSLGDLTQRTSESSKTSKRKRLIVRGGNSIIESVIKPESEGISTSEIKTYGQWLPPFSAYACHICGKPFSNTASKSQHIPTHSWKQFACLTCSRQFSYIYSLQRHCRKFGHSLE